MKQASALRKSRDGLLKVISTFDLNDCSATPATPYGLMCTNLTLVRRPVNFFNSFRNRLQNQWFEDNGLTECRRNTKMRIAARFGGLSPSAMVKITARNQIWFWVKFPHPPKSVCDMPHNSHGHNSRQTCI